MGRRKSENINIQQMNIIAFHIIEFIETNFEWTADSCEMQADKITYKFSSADLAIVRSFVHSALKAQFFPDKAKSGSQILSAIRTRKIGRRIQMAHWSAIIGNIDTIIREQQQNIIDFVKWYYAVRYSCNVYYAGYKTAPFMDRQRFHHVTTPFDPEKEERYDIYNEDYNQAVCTDYFNEFISGLKTLFITIANDLDRSIPRLGTLYTELKGLDELSDFELVGVFSALLTLSFDITEDYSKVGDKIVEYIDHILHPTYTYPDHTIPRDDIMCELHRSLPRYHTVILTGFAGYGKTFCAKLFAKVMRRGDDESYYYHIINAEKRENIIPALHAVLKSMESGLQGNYNTLCNQMLNATVNEQADIMDFISNFYMLLSVCHRRWTILYDNVDFIDDTDKLNEFIECFGYNPANCLSQSMVIITTQFGDVNSRGGVLHVPVGKISPDDERAYLGKIESITPAQVDELCKHTNQYVLAVAQAYNFIKAAQKGKGEQQAITEYINELNTVMKRRKNTRVDEHKNLVITVEILVNRLVAVAQSSYGETAGETMELMLYCFSLFPYNEIKLCLNVFGRIGVLAESSDCEQLDDMVSILLDRDVIQINSVGYEMHPTTQAILLNMFKTYNNGKEYRSALYDTAVYLISRAEEYGKSNKTLNPDDISFAEKIHSLIKTETESADISKPYMELSYLLAYHNYNRDSNKALSYYMDAINAAEGVGSEADYNRAKYLMFAGICAKRVLDYDNANTCFEESIKTFSEMERNAKERGIVLPEDFGAKYYRCYYEWGLSEQEHLDDYKRELELYEAAELIADRYNCNKAVVYRLFGISYRDHGDFLDAIDSFNKSIDADKNNTNNVSRTYNNMAVLYLGIGLLDDTLKSLSDAEDNRKAGNHKTNEWLSMNFCRYYSMIGDIESAKKHLFNAIEYMTRNNDGLKDKLLDAVNNGTPFPSSLMLDYHDMAYALLCSQAANMLIQESISEKSENTAVIQSILDLGCMQFGCDFYKTAKIMPNYDLSAYTFDRIQADAVNYAEQLGNKRNKADVAFFLCIYSDYCFMSGYTRNAILLSLTAFELYKTRSNILGMINTAHRLLQQIENDKSMQISNLHLLEDIKKMGSNYGNKKLIMTKTV